MSFSKPIDGMAMEMNEATVRYELERFHARVTFDQSIMDNIKMSSYRHEMTSRLTWELTGIVAVWRAGRVLKVPANWWEHFKQRWFPAWALKRWPVLCEHYDAGVVLPRVPVVRPEYHMVEFPTWRRSEGL